MPWLLYLTGRLAVNIKPYSSCRELCEADLYCYRWFCYWPLHCLLWHMGQLQTTKTTSLKSQRTSLEYREPTIHGLNSHLSIGPKPARRIFVSPPSLVLLDTWTRGRGSSELSTGKLQPAPGKDFLIMKRPPLERIIGPSGSTPLFCQS